MLDDEEFRRRRGYSQEPQKLNLKSGRIGPKGRTFHLKVGSATKAQPIGKGASVDYIARQGDYSKKRADFESSAGRDPEQMKSILDAVHETTNRKNGRVAIPITIEMPNDLTADARNEIAQKFCEYFEAQNHPAIAVIHGNGKEQPHMHLLTTSRPTRSIDDPPQFFGAESGGWVIAKEGIRGSAQKGRMFANRNEIKLFRRQVAAGIINQVLEAHGHAGNWHGGTLKETGIEREAKKRVREAEWAKGIRERDEKAAADYHKEQSEAREQAAKVRHEREKRREAKKSELQKQADRAPQFQKEMAKARSQNRSERKAALQLAERLLDAEARLEAAERALDTQKRKAIPPGRKAMTEEARTLARDLLKASGRNPADFQQDLENGGSPELWQFVRESLGLKKVTKEQSVQTEFRAEPLKAKDLEQANRLTAGFTPHQLEATFLATKSRLDGLGSSVGDQLERHGLKTGLKALQTKLPNLANKSGPSPSRGKGR